MDDEVTYLWGQLLSKEDVKRVKFLWGKQIEQYLEKYLWNPGFDTGLPGTINIISFIENDQRLNERSIELEKRIAECLKKGRFTPSSSYNSISVEDNLLFKLVQDAVALANKDLPYADHVIKSEDVTFNDIRRIYKLPLGRDIMKKVAEQEKRVSIVPEPKKIYDLKHQYGPNHNDNGDVDSCYKEYHIKGELSTKGQISNGGLPYVGKLYQSYGDDYFQLYVDDCKDRHWALHSAIDSLVKRKMVKLA